MRAPRLSLRLTLEAPQRVPDGGGGWQVSWAPVGNLWADLRTSRGREVIEGLRESKRITHKVTVRAAAEGSDRRPVPDQRFRKGGRVFNIRAVSEADGRGAFLTCWVEEGAPT